MDTCNRTVIAATVLGLVLLQTMDASRAAGEQAIDLSGTWAFQLDANDRGAKQRWFTRDLPEQIKLPGSLQEQGFGNDVSVETKWTGAVIDRSWYTDAKYAKYRMPGNVKVPFWLQPDKHYVGVAWYQREVRIPADWKGRRVTLSLERPHWATRVWLDDKAIGTRDSLSTPHEYDLGTSVAPGRHRLTIRVDNRMIVDVGINAHSVSDHTQTNWNGIIGRIELRARPPVWIDDVQVYPNVAKRSARVKAHIGNATGRSLRGTLTLQAESTNTERTCKPPAKATDVEITTDGANVEVVYPLGNDAPLWDEFNPALFQLTARLDVKTGATPVADQRTVTFGLREITVQGTRFAINGRPTFIRGTLECCIFPLTGYPPTDVEHWKRVLRVARSHGLNTLRFHSWCPPEAAFVAADEMGFFLQAECAAWAKIGQGEPIDAWLYAEGERILRTYGNHPSFTMMAYGNEPGGPYRRYLIKWLKHFKARDGRRVYTSAAGWPAMDENQYHNIPAPRIQAWGAGLRSRINAQSPETRTDYSDHVRKAGAPIVSHEIGQWCAYPNFDEIPKYTGVLKARNFEIFRDTLRANHMGDQARDFLFASGKLQTLCYKEDIESALRTPGFGGFHLLDLHDFPGQGTALVGVLDAFWDEKGYVTPAEYRRFCNTTVPLARLDKRYWKTNETFVADIDVTHFGAKPLHDAVVAWKLVDEAGHTIADGKLPARTIHIGGPTRLGTVKAPLSTIKPARKLTLVVNIEGTWSNKPEGRPITSAVGDTNSAGGRTMQRGSKGVSAQQAAQAVMSVSYENDWDIWVFADRLDMAAPSDVLVTDTLDEATVERLRAGGKVLLTPPASCVRTNVTIGFSSIFWNTAWTRNQPPHTLGILCDPKHAVFDHFPTDFHSDWQWWELIDGSAAMVLDDLPPKLRPLVQPIDTWFENRRLGLLFEARLLGGKLMVCSMNLGDDLDDRIVARQMRHSVMSYMAGDSFAPRNEVSLEQVRSLFREPTTLQRLGATITPSSEQRGHEATLAMDGRVDTIWHTNWDPAPKKHPHHLIIDLGRAIDVRGLVVTPRQDMANGRIARFEVYVSDNAGQWGKPAASGTWSNDGKPKTVRLPKAVRARFTKLVALSEVRGGPWASVAEVDVLVNRPAD